jgi:hypothetical protein
MRFFGLGFLRSVASLHEYGLGSRFQDLDVRISVFRVWGLGFIVEVRRCSCARLREAQCSKRDLVSSYAHAPTRIHAHLHTRTHKRTDTDIPNF